MATTIYVYSKCSTCRDATHFLEQRKINFVRKEITETPPSIEELRKMFSYQNDNLKKLFNTSGLLYKELKLSEKLSSLSVDQALTLLHQQGMLVKRPFLIGNDFGLTGFKESEWVEVLRQYFNN